MCSTHLYSLLSYFFVLSADNTKKGPRILFKNGNKETETKTKICFWIANKQEISKEFDKEVSFLNVLVDHFYFS